MVEFIKYSKDKVKTQLKSAILSTIVLLVGLPIMWAFITLLLVFLIVLIVIVFPISVIADLINMVKFLMKNE